MTRPAPNTVALPPGVVPMSLKDVDVRLSEAVGMLMRRHHHAEDSTCDWCLVVSRHLLAAATNLIKAHAHREDPVAAFIRRHRDGHTQRDEVGSAAHVAVDDLLDAYRLHADTGVPLTEPTPSPAPPGDDGERQEPLTVTVPGLTEADHSTVNAVYDRSYLTYLGAHVDLTDEPDNSDDDLNRTIKAQRHALREVAAYVHGLSEKRHMNDASHALLTFRDLNHFPSRFDSGACCCGEDIDDDDMRGCAQWRALTDAARDVRIGGSDPTPTVLHRAVDGYNRCGIVADVDVFGEVLADLGAKLTTEFRVFRAAFHADAVNRLPYPVTVVDQALALLSALTGALNQTRTPTAAEIVDSERGEEVTPAGDAVRLHLVSHHWLPEALGMTDEAAERLHGYIHAGRLKMWRTGVPHDVADMTVNIDDGIMIVAKMPASEGGDTYRELFRQWRDRYVFGAEADGTTA